jgi:hypothetical protein
MKPHRGNVQCREVFLRKTILLVSPLVETHTTVIGTRLATKECHAVFRCSITCSHNVSPPSGRRSAIDGADASHSVLFPVVSNVESDDRVLAVRGCAFNDHDLGYLPILAKVVIGTQRRNQLNKLSPTGNRIGVRWWDKQTSSFAKRGFILTMYTTLRCTTRTFARCRLPNVSKSLRSRSLCFFSCVKRL